MGAIREWTSTGRREVEVRGRDQVLPARPTPRSGFVAVRGTSGDAVVRDRSMSSPLPFWTAVPVTATHTDCEAQTSLA